MIPSVMNKITYLISRDFRIPLNFDHIRFLITDYTLIFDITYKPAYGLLMLLKTCEFSKLIHGKLINFFYGIMCSYLASSVFFFDFTALKVVAICHY